MSIDYAAAGRALRNLLPEHLATTDEDLGREAIEWTREHPEADEWDLLEHLKRRFVT